MTDPADRLDSVQDAIGYRFTDPGLLEVALTHSSHASEQGIESYERLEFLGDAVLELAVTSEIYDTLDGASEGRMTRIRAAIVDEATLAQAARTAGLPDAIRLGIGEDRSGGRNRSSIQSDVIEAVFGAVYLDGGLVPALAVVHKLLGPTMESRMAAQEVVDPRSNLQERMAKQGKTVSFAFARTGPDHAVEYSAEASVDDAVIGTGTGPSKKAAAIDAARAALVHLA